MNIVAFIRLGVVSLLALSCVCSGQTVREQLKDPDFRLYTVVFSFTVDAQSKVQSFKVYRIFDPKSPETKLADVQVPPEYIDSAKIISESRHKLPYRPGGKPIEFFSCFRYTPNRPTVVITNLDFPADAQP